MTRRITCTIALCALVLSLLAACKPSAPAPAPSTGGSTAAPLASAATPETKPASNDAPANRPTPAPLSLKVSLDETQAKEGEINQEGGEVIASGPSGVRYTLTIPPKALNATENIRVVPVSAIDGLPFSGGLLGAVQLEPDGLYFVQPATLKIEVPAGFKPKDMVAFAYQGGGEDFHMYPAEVKDTTITLQISHFSSYGGSQGTAEEVSMQLDRTPSSAEAQVQQEIAGEMNRWRREGGELDLDKIEQPFRDWFEKIIVTLKAAEKDDKMIDAAGKEFLTWWNAESLLGLRDRLKPLEDRGFVSLEIGLKNAFDQSYKRCVNEKKPYEIATMLRRLRDIGFLDNGDNFKSGDYTMQGKDRELDTCQTFKVKFDSTITWELLTGTWSTVHHVTSEVVVHPEDNHMVYNGTGKLAYEDFQFKLEGEMGAAYGPCTTEAIKSSTHLDVVNSMIDFPGAASGNPTPKIMLALQPGKITEKGKYSCSGSQGWMTIDLNQFEMPMWNAGFDPLHKNSTYPGLEPPAYTFGYFQPGEGEVLAVLEKEYETTVNEDVPVKEQLKIEIVHAPGE